MHGAATAAAAAAAVVPAGWGGLDAPRLVLVHRPIIFVFSGVDS
jgi:hypothetical protein